MDPTTLRQCHDLVENLDRYVHHYPKDKIGAIYLVQVGPVTFFVIDGTGDKMRITRVQGEARKIIESFWSRAEAWQKETGLDPKPCFIDIAAETLLWMRDHPGTVDAIKLYVSGKMTLSSVPGAVRLGKLMRKALGWRPGPDDYQGAVEVK